MKLLPHVREKARKCSDRDDTLANRCTALMNLQAVIQSCPDSLRAADPLCGERRVSLACPCCHSCRRTQAGRTEGLDMV